MKKLENEMNRVMQRWVLDPTPDADSNYVIRVANGTLSGGDAVATVYGLALAQTIIAEHNHFKGA